MSSESDEDDNPTPVSSNFSPSTCCPLREIDVEDICVLLFSLKLILIFPEEAFFFLSKKRDTSKWIL